jgi:hypothetical protein
MISRIWRGWTTFANADAYEALLKEEIFAGIAARRIPGYRGIQLLRRVASGEVRFIKMKGIELEVEYLAHFLGTAATLKVMPLG